MDELVAVGTAGIAGLIITALVSLGALAWIASAMASAWVAGDFRAIVSLALALLLIGALYLGTGLWLQRTGRI